MVRVLAAIAILFVLSAILLLITLAIRRIVLGRRARAYAAAEHRVRPIAIGLIEGQGGAMPPLSGTDQEVLADVLGRYTRKLTGDAETRIAEYFRTNDALARPLHDLRDRRWWHRAAAAYRLGDMACAEPAPALLTALDDRRRAVRAAAARSLGRLRITDAAKPLVEALVARRVPRSVAAQALVELGPEAVPELQAIARHPSWRLRRTAVTLLGIVGGSREAPVAVDALRDPSADVRAAAAGALRRIGGATAEPPLRSALDDRIPFVRAEAAESLGVIGSTTALPHLLEIARTDRFRPARAAAEAVARIDPKALAEAAAEPGAGPHLHQAADLSGV